jgi:hypothetical protein
MTLRNTSIRQSTYILDNPGEQQLGHDGKENGTKGRQFDSGIQQ